MIYLVVILVSFLSGTIQRIAGFGAGIIMMLVFPHFFGILKSAALNQAICITMTAYLAWKYRAWLKPRIFLLPAICCMCSSMLVISISDKIPLDLLSLLLGFVLLFLSFYFLFLQHNIHIQPTPRNGILCGLISGTFSGLFSLGAPINALYFLSVTKEREAYLGNMQLMFTLTNFVSLATRFAKGHLTPDMLLPTLLGLLSLMLGQQVGQRLSDKLSGPMFNQVVYSFVGVAGGVTILEHMV